MYVCVCHAVTERRLRLAIRAGADSVEKLANTVGVTTSCGACRPRITEMLAVATEPDNALDRHPGCLASAR